MTGILRVTDGAGPGIDFRSPNSGFHLIDWTPVLPEPKGDGEFHNSPLSDGRHLVSRYVENAIEIFMLTLNGDRQDAVIRDSQELRRLLQKATEFWVTDWQTEPVWIEARGQCETNTRYAVIIDWRAQNDDNPYMPPFLASGGSGLVAMEDFTASLEHLPWQHVEPLTGEATEVSAQQAYLGITYGRAATTTDEVFVGNKHNEANLTHVYDWTAGPIWSGNHIGAGLPLDFLPAVPVTGDIVYFGCETTAEPDSGTFDSVVFDISTASTNITGLAWEYWNGGWLAIPSVDDNTANFTTLGVTSAQWRVPSDWATVAVNGVTGYWVRAVVTANPAATPPAQNLRDFYAIVVPFLEIADTAVEGDLSALIKCTLWNRTLPAVVPGLRRAYVGLRSLSRGANFRAYLNAANEQYPTGITSVTAGANTTFVAYPTPTGIAACYNPPGAQATAERVGWNFNATLNKEYSGDFRLFLRYFQDGGSDGDFTASLSFVGYGIQVDTVTKSVRAGIAPAVPQAIDMGVIRLPLFADTLGEDIAQNLAIDLHIANSNAAPGDLYIFDLVILPTDEWAAEISVPDPSLGGIYVGESELLLIDSIGNPRVELRTAEARLADEAFSVRYTHSANGPAILQANKDQRLWFFTTDVDFTDPTEMASYFENAHIGRVWKAQRYFSMRGTR